jgi:hypothetical protein
LLLSAPSSEEKVVWVGAFDDFRFSEEHQYGYGLDLWRQENVLLGLFFVAQGLAGDTPRAALEDAQHNPTTGALSFGARLTRGTHHCQRHENVPAREIYRFEGMLEPDRLVGELTRVDALHPGAPFETRRLELKRAKDREESPFDSFSAWWAFVERVHRVKRDPW